EQAGPDGPRRQLSDETLATEEEAGVPLLERGQALVGTLACAGLDRPLLTAVEPCELEADHVVRELEVGAALAALRREKLGGGGEPSGRLPLGPVAHHFVHASGHAARGALNRLERHLLHVGS